MDDCENALAKETWISTLDNISSYWQVPNTEEDQDKTGFTCQSRTCRFICMPFGLINGLGTIQRTLDILLSGNNWRTCLVYIDYVNVFFKSFDAYLMNVDMVLSALRKVGVSLNVKKCSFFTDSVNHVRQITQSGGLTVDEARVESFSQLQHPRNVTELRSFFVLCNVHRPFVLN